MSKKVSYIKSIYAADTEFSFVNNLDEAKTNQRLTTLNSLFKKEAIATTIPIKAKPHLKRGQIWLVDSMYYDYCGNLVSANHSYLVLITDAEGDIEGECFCRVQPLSYFTEYVSKDDYTVDDASLVGFRFLVETWNEQPILCEILKYCVGVIEIFGAPNLIETIILSDEQIQFRTLEVNDTAYLRNSVLTYLTFLEEKQTIDTNIVININEKPFRPKFYINDSLVGNSFLMAAKTKVDKQNKYFELSQQLNNETIKIRVKRNDDDFIISVYTTGDLVLKSNDGKSINRKKAEDRIIFTDVKPGLYFLENYNDNKITIRLK